jgi:hypothetical protein
LILKHFLHIFNSLGRVVCTLFYAIMRPFSRQFDASVRTERTRLGDLHEAQFRLMASPSAAEGEVCQRDFLRRKDSEEWALEVERRIDRGEPALARSPRDTKTFGHLINFIAMTAACLSPRAPV